MMLLRLKMGFCLVLLWTLMLMAPYGFAQSGNRDAASCLDALLGAYADADLLVNPEDLRKFYESFEKLREDQNTRVFPLGAVRVESKMDVSQAVVDSLAEVINETWFKHTDVLRFGHVTIKFLEAREGEEDISKGSAVPALYNPKTKTILVWLNGLGKLKFSEESLAGPSSAALLFSVAWCAKQLVQHLVLSQKYNWDEDPELELEPEFFNVDRRRVAARLGALDYLKAKFPHLQGPLSLGGVLLGEIPETSSFHVLPYRGPATVVEFLSFYHNDTPGGRFTGGRGYFSR